MLTAASTQLSGYSTHLKTQKPKIFPVYRKSLLTPPLNQNGTTCARALSLKYTVIELPQLQTCHSDLGHAVCPGQTQRLPPPAPRGFLFFPHKSSSLPRGLPRAFGRGFCLCLDLAQPRSSRGSAGALAGQRALQFAIRACPISVTGRLRANRQSPGLLGQLPSWLLLDRHSRLAPAHPSPAGARWPGSSHALPAPGPGAPGAPGSQGRPQHPLLRPELRAAEAGVPAEGPLVRGPRLPGQQRLSLLQREAPDPLRVEAARGECGQRGGWQGRGSTERRLGGGRRTPDVGTSAEATVEKLCRGHTSKWGMQGVGPRASGCAPPPAL